MCDTFNNRITVWDGAAHPDAVRHRRRHPAGQRWLQRSRSGWPTAPAGELYVADWFNHRIQKFNADGNFAWQKGNYGPKDGSLVFPRNVWSVTARST